MTCCWLNVATRKKSYGTLSSLRRSCTPLQALLHLSLEYAVTLRSQASCRTLITRASTSPLPTSEGLQFLEASSRNPATEQLAFFRIKLASAIQSNALRYERQCTRTRKKVLVNAQNIKKKKIRPTDHRNNTLLAEPWKQLKTNVKEKHKVLERAVDLLSIVPHFGTRHYSAGNKLRILGTDKVRPSSRSKKPEARKHESPQNITNTSDAASLMYTQC